MQPLIQEVLGHPWRAAAFVIQQSMQLPSASAFDNVSLGGEPWRVGVGTGPLRPMMMLRRSVRHRPKETTMVRI